MKPITYSAHMLRQAKEKGFTAEQILSALTNPEKITDVRRYPGQKRYCGAGVAVIVTPDRCAVTIYADGIVTPIREDQKNDPAAINSKRLTRAR